VREFDGLRLFLERAEDASPGFALTAMNAATVLEICRRLDGIPLALELAAAWLGALELDDMARGLDDRFRLLSRGGRTAQPRHKTLRSLIDWSYDLLTEPERRLLTRLAVFTGGWTAEAARTVCSEYGGDTCDVDVDDGIASLVDKSLVSPSSCNVGKRYQMLETVREYAREKLEESCEYEFYFGRHRDWFLDLTETACRCLGGKDAAGWIARVEDDHENIRAAIRWSLQDAVDADAGLRFAGAMQQFWYMRGYTGEGLSICRQALSIQQSGGRSLCRLRALIAGGLMAYVQTEHAESARMYKEAVRIGRDLKELYHVAVGLNGLGVLADEQGDYASARRWYTRALKCSRAQPGGGRSMTYLSNLGGVASLTGDYEGARQFMIEALELCRRSDDVRAASFCLHGLGWTYHRETDYVSSKLHYSDALEVRRAAGFRMGEMETLFELGELAHAENDMAVSRGYLSQALLISREVKVARWECIVLSRLGRVLADCDDLAEARRCLMQATQFFIDAADRENVSACFLGWTSHACAIRDFELAARFLGASMRMRRECSQVVHPHDLRVWLKLEMPVRAAVGDDIWAAERARGESMSFRDALAFWETNKFGTLPTPARKVPTSQ